MQDHGGFCKEVQVCVCFGNFEESPIRSQSFVAPTIILAASVWIASNCFFEPVEQLSHTESLYSSRGRM